MKIETIKAVTAKCDREDCQLYSNGMGGILTTFPDTFDRQGNKQSHPSSSRMFEHVACFTCGSTWNVKHGGPKLIAEKT